MSQGFKITPARRVLSLLLAVMFVVSGFSLEVFATDNTADAEGSAEVISEDTGSDAEVVADEPEVVSGADVPENELVETIEASTDEPVCEACGESNDSTGPPVVKLMGTENGSMYFDGDMLGLVKEYEPGDEVVIHALNDEGYSLRQFAVTEDKDNGEIIRTWFVNNTALTFTMPAYNVRVYALFERGDAMQNDDAVPLSDDMELREPVKSEQFDVIQYMLDNLDAKYVDKTAPDFDYESGPADVMQGIETWVDDDWSGDKLDDLELHSYAQFSDRVDIMGSHMYNYLPKSALLYDVDSDSDYYVGVWYLPDVNADVREISDVAFAHANLQGEVLDDVVFDKTTGMVYVPKKYVRDDKLIDVKGQLLLKSVDSDSSYSYGVPVSITSDLDFVNDGGIVYGDSTESTFAVKVMNDQYEFGFVDFDDIKVKANGYDLGKPLDVWSDGDDYSDMLSKDGLWTFDATDGYIYFLFPVSDAISIDIEVTSKSVETGLGKMSDQGDTSGIIAYFPTAYAGGKKHGRIYKNMLSRPGNRAAGMKGTGDYSYANLDVTEGLYGANLDFINGKIDKATYDKIYKEVGFWEFFTTKPQNGMTFDFKGNIGGAKCYPDKTYADVNWWQIGKLSDAQLIAHRMSNPYLVQWQGTYSGGASNHMGNLNLIDYNSGAQYMGGDSLTKTMSMVVWDGNYNNSSMKYAFHTDYQYTSHVLQFAGGGFEWKAKDGSKVRCLSPGGTAGWSPKHLEIKEWDLPKDQYVMRYNMVCGHVSSIFPGAFKEADNFYNSLWGSIWGAVDNRDIAKMKVSNVETIGPITEKSTGKQYTVGTFILTIASPMMGSQYGIGMHKCVWRMPNPTKTTDTDTDLETTDSSPDTPRITVTLQKVDEDGNGVAGAEFSLNFLDSKTRKTIKDVNLGTDADPVNRWKTGPDGTVTIDLTDYITNYGKGAVGNWYFYETKAPTSPVTGKEYKIENPKVPFKVTQYPPDMTEDKHIEQLTCVATNKDGGGGPPEFAPICFTKESEYPWINSCNDAYDLSGAQYELKVQLDPNNEQHKWVIDRLDLKEPYIMGPYLQNTDSKGKVCFEGLDFSKYIEPHHSDTVSDYAGFPLGATFTLTEKSPTNRGYLINKEPITGTIEKSYTVGSGEDWPVFDEPHLEKPFYDVNLVVEKYDEELKDLTHPESTDPEYPEDNLHPTGGSMGTTDVNEAQGSASLEGALFEFSFYVGQLDRQAIARANQENGDGSPLFRFVLPTYKMSNGKWGIDMNDESNRYAVQDWVYNCAGAPKQYTWGDFYNYELNKFMWPAGTLAIREIKAPEGYNLHYKIAQYEDGKVINGPVQDDMLILHIDDTLRATVDLEDPVLHCLYDVTVEEEDIFEGGPEMWKHDADRITYVDADGAETIRNNGDIDKTAWSKLAQGNASLAGAVFEIINDSKNSVVVNGRTYVRGAVVGKMVTDEKGYANYPAMDLPYGDYIVREVEAPKGYDLGVGTGTYRDPNNPLADPTLGQNPNEYRYGLQDVLSYDIEYDGLEQNVAYVLTGTVLVNGQPAIGQDGKELTVRQQFSVPTEKGKFTQQFSYDAWFRFQEGGTGTYSIRLDKIEKAVVGSLPGVEFVNPEITDENKADYIDLSTGLLDEVVVGGVSWNTTRQYVLKDGTKDKIQVKFVVPDSVDLKAVPISVLSSNHGVADIRVHTDTSPEFGKSEDGGFSADTVLTRGTVDASAGPISVDVEVDDKTAWPFEFTVVHPADLDAVDMSCIKSMTANAIAPNYKAWVGQFSIREDGKVVKVNDWQNNPVLEPIWRGGFKISKIDCPTKLNEAEGDGNLKAHFGVINKSKYDVYVNGKWYAPGDQCFDFWTDEKTGYYTSTNKLLPYGTYDIIELEPSTGYQKNSAWKQTVVITVDGQINDYTTSNPVCQVPISGDVQLVKYDYDMQKSESMNGASLAGIKFELYNRSKKTVKYKGALYKPGALMDTLVTHWNEEVKAYTAETKDNSLPYGTYGLKEIGSTDAKGNFVSTNGKYLVLDKNEAIFEIRNQGETVTYGWMRKVDQNTRPSVTDPDAVTGTRYEDLEKLYPEGSVDPEGYEKTFLRWFNKIPRGDIQFNKRAEDTQKGMKTAWLVTSVWNPHDSLGEKPANPEQHIIITDDNGRFDSNEMKYEGIAHEWETNGNDYLLPRVLAGDALTLDPNAENMDGYECGVWFGKGEFGTQTTPADNSQGAFPYGVYEFQEIRSDTNVGYGLARFTVKVYQNGVTVEFGTVNDSLTSINTKAFDGKTGIQSGCASRDVLIVDEVHFAGLEANRKYTLETYVVDSADGSFLMEKDKDGNYQRIMSTTTFTPDDTKGMQKTELKFNGEGMLEGKTVTIYQYLYDAEGNLVAYHDAVDDKDEQVTYPLIHTTALSETTKGHEVSTTEDGDVIVNDTVFFDNLTPGYNYEVTGHAVDSVSGIEYPDITATTTFMPKEPKGSVTLTFKFDAKELIGKKIVFYETLSYDSQIIAKHEDITDEEQSIYIPEIKTSAKDAVTKEHITNATETVTIEDTVTYTNLVPGTEYEMRGTLMDKETGKPIESDGKPVTATQKFTPVLPSGTVVLTFTFNGVDLTGKAVVAFEECYRDNKKVCVHTDIDDEEQTIRFPKLSSNAVFTDSGLKEGKAESPTRLTETFFYENLTPGVEYELVVVPMDYHAKAGIHVPMTGDGQVGVTHLEKRVLFTPDSPKGELTVDFEIDATILAGHTIVMFDTVYRDGKQVAQHQDWEDKEQTLRFVGIGTTLTNSETGDHLGQTVEKLELVDTVAYRNLIVGETYTMKGHLVDGETGEQIGEEVSVQFSPENENGTVELKFTIDARELGGHRVVAFERLYRNEVEIARHEDINDDNQTVRFPQFSTVLHARDNVLTKEIQTSEAAMLTDTIKYTNLVPNYTYKMKGSLVERSSGKTLKDEHGDFVERELLFTPKDPDGEISMDFTFSSKDMAGQYVVAFQELYVVKTSEDGTQTDVLLHEAKDLNDANETIRFIDRGPTPTPTPTPPVTPSPTPDVPGTPKPSETPEPDGPWIRTTALDKNTQTHMAEANEKAVIIDTVKYGNLEVGKTYRMEGTLMDKATGKPVTDAEGNPLVSSTTFTTTDTHGTVEMSFTIDSTTMWGAHLVVFEKCFEITADVNPNETPNPNATPNPDATPVPEKEVAKHEDIDDADQSIYVAKIGTKATIDGGNKASKPSKTTTVVDTVEYENLIPGVTYTMKGSLIDKSTQKAINLSNGGTTVETTFTPEKPNGTVALTFTFDSTGIKNASIVAVEYLYDRNGYMLTYHADLNDEDQTVFINEDGIVPIVQTPDTGVDNKNPLLVGTLAVLLSVAGIAVLGLLYKKKRRQNELF